MTGFGRKWEIKDILDFVICTVIVAMRMKMRTSEKAVAETVPSPDPPLPQPLYSFFIPNRESITELDIFDRADSMFPLIQEHH